MSESSGSLERWSPVDALRIVVAGLCLLVIVLLDWLVGDDLVEFVSDVLSGLHTINEDVVPVIAVVVRLAAVAALLAGAVSATLRGRWRFLVTVGAGAAVAAVLMLLVDGLLDASAPAAAPVDPILGALGDTGFPSAPGLAAMTGIVAAGVPWFERRERRIGWALVLLLALVRAFVAPVSFETAAALACGALAGALADAAPGHAESPTGPAGRRGRRPDPWRRPPRRAPPGVGGRPGFDARTSAPPPTARPCS